MLLETQYACLRSNRNKKYYVMNQKFQNDYHNLQVLPHETKQNLNAETQSQSQLSNLLIAASNRLYNKLDEITTRHGINYNQYLVLKYYHFKKPQPTYINELVGYMGQRYNIFIDGFRNIKKLHDLGLVYTNTPNYSGRFRGTFISEKGVELLEKINDELNRYDIFQNKIDQGQYEVICRLLENIDSQLNKKS